nr:MAG TPA: DegQ (SacQ) family [Caudoviricetes sp.]
MILPHLRTQVIQSLRKINTSFDHYTSSRRYLLDEGI